MPQELPIFAFFEENDEVIPRSERIVLTGSLLSTVGGVLQLIGGLIAVQEEKEDALKRRREMHQIPQSIDDCQAVNSKLAIDRLQQQINELKEENKRILASIKNEKNG